MCVRQTGMSVWSYRNIGRKFHNATFHADQFY